MQVLVVSVIFISGKHILAYPFFFFLLCLNYIHNVPVEKGNRAQTHLIEYICNPPPMDIMDVVYCMPNVPDV